MYAHVLLGIPLWVWGDAMASQQVMNRIGVSIGLARNRLHHGEAEQEHKRMQMYARINYFSAPLGSVMWCKY